MTKFLSNLLYRLWLVFATLIILLAVAISISRILLPYSNDYKHHLEDWLTGRIGQEVKIGDLLQKTERLQ